MSADGRTLPRPRLSRRAAFLAMIVLLLAAAVTVPARQILAQRGELSRLEERVATLQAERDRLAKKVERLRDPEELERLARRCLGMVKPGEIAIVTVPEEGEPPPTDC